MSKVQLKHWQKGSPEPGLSLPELRVSFGRKKGKMKAIIKPSHEIEYSGFRLTPSGVLPVGQPTYKQWEEVGKFISRCEQAVHFWIGDWLNYGEMTYEEFSQELDDRWNYKTLANDKYIASKIPFSRRREKLSYSHHAEVAPLEPREQEEWLDKAEKNEWTRERLRLELQEVRLDSKEGEIDEREVVPYGENIFYLSTKWQDREDSYHIINKDDHFPTLKRRSWFYHPSGREFSLREYADVQEFPRDFKFVGTYEKIKDQIGNAVSPTMASYVGKMLKGKTFGDLFAGAGGLSCGLLKEGKVPVWAVERSMDFARTYKLNHPNTKIFTRDIKKIDPSNLEKVDIIVGGPPCQGFSLAGSRFKDDPRNKLYKEFVRFVKKLKPREFLMENVLQIKEAKKEIASDFEQLGYKVKSFVVKGEKIGMRQHRNRYFFLGEKNGSN